MITVYFKKGCHFLIMQKAYNASLSHLYHNISANPIILSRVGQLHAVNMSDFRMLMHALSLLSTLLYVHVKEVEKTHFLLPQYDMDVSLSIPHSLSSSMCVVQVAQLKYDLSLCSI